MTPWDRIRDALGMADETDDHGGSAPTQNPGSGTGTTADEAGDDGPFRATVQDVFTVDGVGTVVSVRVEQGRLTPGDAVEVEPGASEGTVETIERHHSEVPAAEAGDHVGLAVDGLDASEVDADCRLYGVE